eukprot:m.23152 g.23152  ORF g.23152 m.23152 type:complete len:663 (+) comp14085_c0_seq1:128-2116(+)
MRRVPHTLSLRQCKQVSTMFNRNGACSLRKASSSTSTKKYDWNAVEKKLPLLPLPTLQETCARYLEQLKPLLNDEEFAHASRGANQFVSSSSGIQSQLQSLAEIPNTSYIKPYWDEMYLNARYPVPINSNPFVAFEPDPLRQSQADRAASLIYAMLKWREGMRLGLIEPDGTSENPLCMSEYDRLFGTTRIPVAHGRDEHVTKPNSTHIVLLRGTKFYKVEVVDKDHKIASQELIKSMLEHLINHTPGTDAIIKDKVSLATLTAVDRDVWGAARSEIANESERNSANLVDIDSAILHCCLDYSDPQTQTERFESFLHGGPSNEPRYYDKSISLIVTPSGAAAVNFEHSPMDGATLIRMMNDSWHDAQGLQSGKQVPDHVTECTWPVLTVKPLEFDFSEHINTTINEAAAAFARVRDVTRVHAFHFNNFGAKEIKSWGVGPDGTLQMAFQLAYYRMHGKTDISVYSSASTKRFRYGRTEAARCTSVESVAFVQAMAHSAKANSDDDTLRKLLKLAVEKHRATSRLAGQAQGVDRHLFALQRASQSSASPGSSDEMFGQFYQKHQKSTLSTSNCSVFGPAIITPGFGAVCSDGYGLGYVIKNSSVDVCITNYTDDPNTGGAGFGGVKLMANIVSFDTDSTRFGLEIERALIEIKELFAQTRSKL